jgi:FSR family fosmidomycin resistance protein-like MFS transporter
LRRVWYLTLGHLTTDFYLLLFPPLLALIKTHFNLTLVQTSLLPMVVSVFGAGLQPVAGYLADRSNRFVLSALGVLISGVFISAVGLAPSPLILALFLLGASLGSSVFHPTAGSLVTSSAPDRSNLALSIFLTGGTFGMALAPIASTQVVERLGLGSTWILVFPVFIVTAMLLKQAKGSESESRTPPARINLALLRTRAVRPLWVLFAISVLRSLTHFGFINFTAFLGQERGWSMVQIGWVLSGFLISITLGRIAGGYLGDRVTPRKLLAISNAASAPFFLGFCLLDGYLGLASYFVAGFIFDLGITTNIILAQRAMPDNPSTATGMIMGFAWATAGLMIPVVGTLAETLTVSVALAWVTTLLVPAALLVATLPHAPVEARVAAAGGNG